MQSSTLLETGSALRVEEVTRADLLESLRPEWASLWEHAPGATPFQSPEWLLSWWRHFGGDGLCTLTLRREGRLVGLAPLFIYTDPGSGTRQVTLLGNGITDHLDLLTVPELARENATAVLAHLAERRESWDRCDLRDLPAASPLARAPLPNGLREEISEEEPCPALALPRSVDQLAGTVPPKLLAKLRYYRRRAEKEGEVSFEAVTAERVEEALGALMALHRARWAERGEAGMLADPRVERFHREAARGFAERGWLRLYLMRVGGRLAAAHYGFLARGCAFYYLGGFDPAFDRLSPGSLVLLHAVEEAVREGARELDFLRGREPYKYAWSAEDRPQLRRVLCPA
jgi:CelD/BcsL family acetyltransferase involved in cellulose biosynthesis